MKKNPESSASLLVVKRRIGKPSLINVIITDSANKYAIMSLYCY